jgi:hypothetical protein
VILPFIFVLYIELCLLVSLCVCDRCDMTDIDEYHSRSRRPSTKDWDSQSISGVLGDRTIERSSDAVNDMYRTQ